MLENKSVAVVIPAHDEEKLIGATISGVPVSRTLLTNIGPACVPCPTRLMQPGNPSDQTSCLPMIRQNT